VRRVVLYASVTGIIFILASQGTMISKKVTMRDYQEECLSEGCSTEEVRELYASYREECINEGCSKEEVIELGGTPSGALAMLAHFRKLGYEVREKDFMNLQCTPIGSETQCAALVFLCKDIWQCPDGITRAAGMRAVGAFSGHVKAQESHR
jgi:hypothetical protein